MEWNCESPEANLAWDDALLERRQEAFRLWESPVPFVVLGRSGREEEEVHDGTGLTVLRRSSGGGTVLQGPGSLNYTLVLSLERRPEFMSVERSYCAILGAVVKALAMPGLEIRGSDILLDGRKLSGNAQRRTRGWLLHHGTVLYDRFDLDAITQALREPVRRPAHRQLRNHADFVAKLPLSRAELLERLSQLERETMALLCPNMDGLRRTG